VTSPAPSPDPSGPHPVESRTGDWFRTPLHKAAYAAVNLGVGGVEYIIAVFLLKYYTDYTGLDVGLAGIALLLAKVFDAVSDPIMGYVSDHTRTPWGRRRPWFLIGIVPLTFGFVGLFSADPVWSETRLFLWLLIMNVLFWSGTTMIVVPHAAFASEMTRTHEERISVMGWREGFMAVGLLVGGLVMFVLLERAIEGVGATPGLAEQASAEAVRLARGEAHGTITAWLGLGACGLALVTFFGTRERARPHVPPRESLFGDFADTLRSRPFRLFTFALVIGQIADGLTVSLALFTIEEWWGYGPPHPRFILIGYMVMAMVSIPLWMRVGRHLEKAHTLSFCTFVGTVSLLGMLLVPRLGLAWAYACMYLAGVGMGGRMVMTMAIVPDIVDDDELRTRTRKDGAYFGMISLLRKLSRSLAMGLSGVGLGVFGYVSGVAEQSAQAIGGIRLLFCIVPAVTSALTALVLLWFPIDRARHAEALEILHRRYEQDAARGPSPGPGEPATLAEPA
jgi:GPH family glycoside/pentoside/hexuronide:cation symporter